MKNLHSPLRDPDDLTPDNSQPVLADGWGWLKQKEGTSRVRDGALELRVLPQQESILAHALPDPAAGPFAVEMTITSLPQPTVQFEQIGLFWYAGGEGSFKFVKELIDGGLYVFPGKKPMTEATVTLRLVVDGGKFVAQYQPKGEGEPLEAFSGPVPEGAGDGHQIAIAGANGPADAEHWVRIDRFNIALLPK
jgi:hypothetical protein